MSAVRVAVNETILNGRCMMMLSYGLNVGNFLYFDFLIRFPVSVATAANSSIIHVQQEQ